MYVFPTHLVFILIYGVMDRTFVSNWAPTFLKPAVNRNQTR